MRSLFGLGLLLLVTACGASGGALNGPVKSPDISPDEEAAASRPIASPKLAGLGEAPAGVPAAPPECRPFTAAPPASCATSDFKEQLAAALSATPEARDTSLRCLEASPEAPRGLMRALRADLAPRPCGDVIVGSEAGKPDQPRELADALVALGVGARLNRSVRQAPLPPPPFTKAQFLKHFKEVLSPWIAEQAHAVDALSQVGPRLSGYGKAVVALEAGLADMRFVGVARSIELPQEMKDDPEIRETYLVALEQALEPRVLRGRDAALVGLGELSRQGITRDPRLAEARALLSELYAGRRIDALDGLLLPALPPATRTTTELQLAASLPAFYALKLASTPSIDDATLLRARLEQGVPPALWLTSLPKTANAELVTLAQRALFQLGQLYFWAEPFGRAAALETPATDPNAALVAGLAKVLARGPRNAAALMLGPPTLPPELRSVDALDALAKSKGSAAGVAGFAEFDAAYLRGLAPPANDPTFWKEQRTRFERAQKALVDKAAKQKAGELAKAAADTEKELRQQTKP
jgi:hypothetical protein